MKVVNVNMQWTEVEDVETYEKNPEKETAERIKSMRITKLSAW